MIASPNWQTEMQDLIDRLQDGGFDDADRVRLNDLLRAGEPQRDYFITYMDVHSRLAWEGGHEPANEPPRHVDFKSESSNPAFPTFPVPTLSTNHHPLTTDFVGGPVFSYMVATVVLCAMLLGAWVYKISNVGSLPDGMAGKSRIKTPYVPAVVGQITGMKDCRWSQREPGTIVGASVPRGRKYSLESGLLQITYITGARVILEGPCNYTVDSDTGGRLQLGKLVARIEKRAERREASAKPQATNPQPPTSSLSTLHSPLFTISTPTAIVTDLGTEFGVEVSENGDTLSLVFQGAVRVDAIAGYAVKNVVLQKNESARVVADENGVRISRNEGCVTPQKFARRIHVIPNRIDLLDIVAGGDGKGTHRERGIDPTTGMQDTMFFAGARGGDRHYRKVDWHPLIDGVFVPDGGAGAVKINSAGNAFDGFPHTCGESAYSIWARAAEIRYKNLQSDRAYWVYNMGRGDRYMPKKRGLLAINSNSGITFDVEAIRRANSDVVPNKFKAYVSLADRVDPTTGLNTRWIADYWIFIDGQLNVKREGFCVKDGTVPLSIELEPTDRFLTLAVTDGGNMDRSGDCLLFGDPVLEASAPKKEMD